MENIHGRSLDVTTSWRDSKSVRFYRGAPNRSALLIGMETGMVRPNVKSVRSILGTRSSDPLDCVQLPALQRSAVVAISEKHVPSISAAGIEVSVDGLDISRAAEIYREHGCPIVRGDRKMRNRALVAVANRSVYVRAPRVRYCAIYIFLIPIGAQNVCTRKYGTNNRRGIGSRACL